MSGLNNVIIIPGQGGSQRPAPGQDYLSGLVFYTDTLPSGFSSGTRAQQVTSLVAAQALGINSSLSDETQATALLTMAETAAAGEVINIYVQEPVNNVLIASYTTVTGDTSSATNYATHVTAAINLLSQQTGYTAIASTDTVQIVARPGLGKFLNTGTPITLTGTAAGDATITEQFAQGGQTAGVASLLIQWWYHIEEYFRLNPTGNLWLYFAPISGQAYDFNELTLIQAAAGGTLRQVGFYLGNVSHWSDAADAATILNAIQAKAAALAATNNTPESNIVGYDLSGVADFTTLTNLGLLSDNRVSLTISQDGTINNDGTTGLGYAIYKASGHSITDVGAKLGAISASAVNQDQAWVQQFNMASTTGLTAGTTFTVLYNNELSAPALCNGHLINNITDNNLLIQLNNYRYLFLLNLNGIAGTYWNDNHCAITISSDYAYINDNRTFDKAARGVRSALLPTLNGPLILTSSGQLDASTIGYFTALCQVPLDAMVSAQEISDYSVVSVTYVQSTNTVTVTIQIIEDGVARNIIVNLGFTNSLS